MTVGYAFYRKASGAREITLSTAKNFLTLIDDPRAKRILCTNGPIKGTNKEKKMATIKTFENEYGVPMLEVRTAYSRPAFISVKKAQAILATNDDASGLVPVVKHGRDLFQVNHLIGGLTFTIGEKKIRLILDNAEAINSALIA